ncbi:MAG TPA: GNAT family N-acetyltransferase [Candidatus Limnocylindrales bacterium]|nr:GNAT family N-acetyltransferase [Candidatus Limnocylindrales bacterium]
MQPLRPDQQRTAAQTLGEAFAADPLLEIVAPDPVRRAKVADRFMAVPLAFGMRHGRVWANEDASAVAVWLHPESGPMSTRRMLLAGLWRMPFVLGMEGMNRFGKAMSVTEAFHHQVEGPHWYLLAIGTRTARQGQGLGSQLIEAGTSQADAAGLPCYLETATDSNIAFYAKRGFEVIGQGDCFGHPLTGMLRQPR